ncbi:hypothetical protein HYPSUDRAFT_39181 [Hypholoma sublateritium FD-334 SS-4]|uniref:Ubiquitin-like protease family profile domain-containing protein n=1 Tax=Hypholoma sublateritium (strain FD-334 SS-4) TaxID=945553 RepID=A0A0D2NZD2_HYPSF|nr:hypothetical protein HYPSUDRAFT_39181 [Hypholoma sublateritium FD-334 SS-4]
MSGNVNHEPPKWTKPPTTIHPPTNLNRRNNMAHASGSNPFGPINPNPRKIGNQTSGRTLVNANVQNEGPPQKRMRVDHTFTRDVKPRSRPSQNGKEVLHTNSKRTSESEEIIIVNDDDVEEYPQSNHDLPNSQSSDELNSFQPAGATTSNHATNGIPSKYTFPLPDTNATRKKANTGLVPDGANTQWVEQTYGNPPDRPFDASDPIESDDYRPTRETRGYVQHQIEEFEKRSAGPKIDLAKKQLSKAKQMKPKLDRKGPNSSTLSKPPLRSSVPSKRKIEDPIATATTLRRPGELEPITLEEVYIEGDHYCQSAACKLQAFSSNERLLYIMAGDDEIFNLESFPKECRTMEYTKPPSPVIHIKTRSTDLLNVFTMCAIPANNKEEQSYGKLFAKLKQVTTPSWVQNRRVLLETARLHMTARGTKDNKDSSPHGDQPNHTIEKARKTPPDIVAPPPPKLRYTPEGQDWVQGSTPNPPPRTGPPRRSTRNAPPEKPVDQDKVILVYPQGVPGAVNITNGDLARLNPGEYLNDTLIEFGLKLWLKDLEAKQPELAAQVHIFNSFFYKKLNNKKNDAAAFETVRKWTSKFDIFQKKYIIVPINEHMHWYLAIIYEPEHVLSAISVDEISPRKRTRLSAKLHTSGCPAETAGATPTDIGESVINSAISLTSSEAEVERNLDADFQNSCTIDVVSADSVDDIGKHKADIDGNSDLSYMTDPELKPSLDRQFPLGGSEQASRSTSTEGLFSDAMDVDDTEDIQGLDKGVTPASVTESTVSATTSTPDIQETPSLEAISTARFYQSIKSKGKQRAAPQHISIDESGVVVPPEAIRKTYIFTFDSLGTNHPHAIKKLGQYLRMEAKDKKGIANAGLAAGKTVFVPVQPNFCDCGVYLLHFAQTFLSDPAKYHRLITSQGRSISNETRQDIWNDKKVADMRQELATQIGQLSTEWKKERASKEKDTQLQGGSDANMINSVDSDSDIEMPASLPKKSGRAARIRG